MNYEIQEIYRDVNNSSNINELIIGTWGNLLKFLYQLEIETTLSLLINHNVCIIIDELLYY